MKRTLAIVVAALAGSMHVPADAGETRGFAVTVFDIAGYYYPNGEDCPQGFNVSGHYNFLRHKLLELGYPKKEVDRLLDPDGNEAGDELVDSIIQRGRIDGARANVYRHPQSVPDPHTKTSLGHYGYGFNLDGKVKPGDFVDPDSGEQGVDNNLYRILACTPYDPDNPRAINPTQSREERNKALRGVWPDYLIEIGGIDDYENDADVTVGYYVSLDFVASDATGRIAKQVSMRIDPDRRWQNVVHGSIKNGVLTTEPFELNLPGHPYHAHLQTYNFKQTRLRVQFTDAGGLKGILGGYHAWVPFYATQARKAWVQEAFMGVDLPGYYYALQRLADASPDPKTGQNTMISTGYFIEAVPANLTRTSPDRVLSASGSKAR